eukprot:jgi/Botrbrau1/3320/Bobra.0048s0016.1
MRCNPIDASLKPGCTVRPVCLPIGRPPSRSSHRNVRIESFRRKNFRRTTTLKMPASEHKASTASDHESGSRPKFVIIGGGLAGLAALIEASRRLSKKGPSGSIILLEKEERVGGNSAKASTGINALTLDKGDTKDLFIQDTLKSGQGLSQEALVTTLVDSSEGALAFLDDLGVHLDKVVQGGGHSRPRTHGPPAGPVGGVIMKQLFITASSLDNVSIITRRQGNGSGEARGSGDRGDICSASWWTTWQYVSSQPSGSGPVQFGDLQLLT